MHNMGYQDRLRSLDNVLRRVVYAVGDSAVATRTRRGLARRTFNWAVFDAAFSSG